MINLIVNMYRYAVGIIFVLGALSAGLLFASSAGVTAISSAIIVLGGTILLVGLSATLLSINDHLAAMRGGEKRNDHAAGATQLSQKQVLIGLGALFLIMVAVGFASASKQNASPQPAATQAIFDDNQAGVSVKDGCVPELAAQIGRKCAE